MIANYRETDFSILFLGSPHVGPELAAVLAKEGRLSGVDTQQATEYGLAHRGCKIRAGPWTDREKHQPGGD